jgi:hypothetical protein
MSTESAPDGGQAIATMPCPACGKRVAAGPFCGRCGTHLSAQRGDLARGVADPRIRRGTGRARAATVGSEYALPTTATSVRQRVPGGLTALLVVLIVCALMRWQPPLIAISTVGLPLVYLTYLRLSDVYHDLPVGTLLRHFTPHRGGHPRLGSPVDRGGRGRNGRSGTVVQAPS